MTMAERLVKPEDNSSSEFLPSKEASRIKREEEELVWLTVRSVKDINKALPSKIDYKKVCWICVDAPDDPQLQTNIGELRLNEEDEKDEELPTKSVSIDDKEDETNSSEEDEDNLSPFEKEGKEIIDTYFSDVIEKKGKATPEEKKQFMSDLYQLATRHGQVTGKWMVFPHAGYDTDRKWRIIARDTIEGNLGCSAKVNPCRPGDKNCVICVYCNDFNNRAACEKVVRRLEEIGMKIQSPFKADAITGLGLYREDYQKLQITGCWGLHYDLIGKSARWETSKKPFSPHN